MSRRRRGRDRPRRAGAGDRGDAGLPGLAAERKPARQPRPVPRVRSSRSAQGLPCSGDVLPRRSEPRRAATPRVRPQSVLRVAPGLASPGHAWGTERRGEPHTRAAALREPAPPQPRPRAAPPRAPAPPHLLGPAPHGSQESPTLFAARDDAGRSDSLHFLQPELLGLGWCLPSTCFLT